MAVMITLRHLKIFITVYEELNMTAAAGKLAMTQPSVSQAIKELESQYETVLFERLARKLYVTEAGTEAYQYAKHIIKLVEEMEDSLKEHARPQTLKVGANYTAGVFLIHKYIEKFKNLYPESEIMVFVNKASILTEMLRKNELDLALIEEIRNEPDLAGEVFADDRIVLVAHPRHRLFTLQEVTVEDIVNEHLLLREKGAGVRNLFDLRMNQTGHSFKPYWESTSTTALVHAAQNQMGIAVLPFHLVREHLDSGSLKEIKIEGLDFNRKLAVVHHKNKFLSRAMQDFMKICHEP